MIKNLLYRSQNFLIDQLKKGTTPHGLALSCAIGVVCGSFPLIGFCTLLSIFLSFFFVLNQPTLQFVNQMMWPVHLLMIPVFIYMGESLFGLEHITVRPDLMMAQFSESHYEFFMKYGKAGAVAFFAWALLAPFYGFLIYILCKKLFRKIHFKIPL